jgi:hypothetical protein
MFLFSYLAALQIFVKETKKKPLVSDLTITGPPEDKAA